MASWIARLASVQVLLPMASRIARLASDEGLTRHGELHSSPRRAMTASSEPATILTKVSVFHHLITKTLQKQHHYNNSRFCTQTLHLLHDYTASIHNFPILTYFSILSKSPYSLLITIRRITDEYN